MFVFSHLVFCSLFEFMFMFVVSEKKFFFHIPTGSFVKTLSFDGITNDTKITKDNVEDQEDHISTVWEGGDDVNRCKLITTC